MGRASCICVMVALLAAAAIAAPGMERGALAGAAPAGTDSRARRLTGATFLPHRQPQLTSAGVREG